MSDESIEAEATPEAPEGATSQAPAAAPADVPEADMSLVLDIPLRMSVEVGRAEMFVRDVLQLTKGSVVELDRSTGEPADLYVNGKRVGRGDLIVVDDRLAIKLVEVGSIGSVGSE